MSFSEKGESILPLDAFNGPFKIKSWLDCSQFSYGIFEHLLTWLYIMHFLLGEFFSVVTEMIGECYSISSWKLIDFLS